MVISYLAPFPRTRSVCVHFVQFPDPTQRRLRRVTPATRNIAPAACLAPYLDRGQSTHIPARLPVSYCFVYYHIPSHIRRHTVNHYNSRPSSLCFCFRLSFIPLQRLSIRRGGSLFLLSLIATLGIWILWSYAAPSSPYCQKIGCRTYGVDQSRIY